ncbi:MAG TPA: acyl carrier protein [Erysipelothrix sp.]|nr:acyl carrier protein [Erysipelothrix sp.]
MKETIKNIVAEILDLEVEEIKDDALIMDDLDADSIAVMEIVMELEDELDVEVPTEDILELNTVGDIVAYIEANK